MLLDLSIKKIADVGTDTHTVFFCYIGNFPSSGFWEVNNSNSPIFSSFALVHGFIIRLFELKVNTFLTFLFANALKLKIMIFMKINGFEFWNRVDGILDEMKLSLGAFSNAIGLSYMTLNSQRKRHSLPKIEQLLDMAAFLHTSVEFLATGNDIDYNLIDEAKAVQNDKELQALVRAILRDRRLLSAISAVVNSYEDNAHIG